MKRRILMIAALLGMATLLLPACEEDKHDDFEGNPTFELKVKDDLSFDAETKTLSVTITSDMPMRETVSLYFALEGKSEAPADLLSYPGSVVFKKGEKAKTITVYVAKGKKLIPGPNGEKMYSYTLKCNRIEGLDMKPAVIKPITLSVKLNEKVVDKPDDTPEEAKPSFSMSIKDGQMLSSEMETITVTIAADKAMPQKVTLTLGLSAKGEAPADLLACPATVVFEKDEQAKDIEIKVADGMSLESPNGALQYLYSLKCSKVEGVEVKPEGIAPIDIAVKLNKKPEAEPSFSMSIKDSKEFSPELRTVTVTIAADKAMPQKVTLTLGLSAKGKAPADLLVCPATVVFEKDEQTKDIEIKVADGKFLGKGESGEKSYTYTLECTAIEGLTTTKPKAIAPIDLKVNLDDMTVRELRLLAAWKAKFNVDLRPFIGAIDVTTTVKVNENDKGMNDNLVENTYTGVGEISIAEGATEDRILLDMPKNAMGADKFIYQALRYNLWDVNGFNIAGGGAPEVYPVVSKAINWTQTSQETFSTSLDDIEITSGGNINFVRDVENIWNGTEKRVPFLYDYSANNRLNEKLKTDATLQKLLIPKDEKSWVGTPAPSYYINYSTIASDDWGEALWVAPTGKLDAAAKTMTFVFCFDTQMSNDYAQIKVVYQAK